VDLIAGRFEQAGAENRSDNATLDSLRQCLGKLKEKDRLLVISHYQHGKSLAECSRIFERGADSLKVTLFRIRQILRRCIDAQQSLDRARS
jgi:DNA-directed RNA polymerase specialized sigma24 family protein